MTYAMIHPLMRKFVPVICQTVPAFAREMTDRVRNSRLSVCFCFCLSKYIGCFCTGGTGLFSSEYLAKYNDAKVGSSSRLFFKIHPNKSFYVAMSFKRIGPQIRICSMCEERMAATGIGPRVLAAILGCKKQKSHAEHIDPRTTPKSGPFK